MSPESIRLDSLLDMLEADPEALIYATRDRIGGSRMTALLDYLYDYADGRCVVCLLPTRKGAPPAASDRAEIGHLVPVASADVSSSRCGFIPGNVAIFCHACNSAAGDYRFHADDVAADLVPTIWPILRKSIALNDDHSDNARMARAERGLPF